MKRKILFRYNEDVLRSIFLVGNQNAVEEDEEDGGNVLPRKCQKNTAEKIFRH